MFLLQSASLRKLEGANKIPCIVKVDLTETSQSALKRHASELSNENGLLLHSIACHRKVICHSVPNHDGEITEQTRRFALPVGYDGLVELLSENGEASAPLTTISQVAESATDQFLIRSRVECLAEVTDKGSSRTLDRGTVLTVKGTAKITLRHTLQTHHYLHCTDKNGHYLYLDYQTVGVFSPLAGPKNISGVHTVSSLLRRFRLPFTIRVVSGKIPKAACDSEMPGVLRLVELRKEHLAFLAPLSAKQMLIPLPLKSNIHFFRPANMKELARHFIFEQIFDTCSQKVQQHMKKFQVVARKKVTPMKDENALFDDVDEIYPYIRQGGLPPRLVKASSMEHEIAQGIESNSVVVRERSTSQPVIASRDRSASIQSNQVLRHHTVSAPVKETSFQFRSTSGSLTLGKTEIIKQFIEKYTSSTSLGSHLSSAGQSSNNSAASEHDNDALYFTLDDQAGENPVSVQEILTPSELSLNRS